MKNENGRNLACGIAGLKYESIFTGSEILHFPVLGQSDMEGNAKFESQDTTVDSRFKSWHFDAAAIGSWETGMLKQCFPY